MMHEDLKDIGMNSLGHRLTLLKAVYETKVKQNVPIDEDNYVPLCEYMFKTSEFPLSNRRSCLGPG